MLNRKSASSLMEGEDVMTMTIDFLRARLLSERSASKAAKERIQELGKKVGLKENLHLQWCICVERVEKGGFGF